MEAGLVRQFQQFRVRHLNDTNWCGQTCRQQIRWEIINMDMQDKDAAALFS